MHGPDLPNLNEKSCQQLSRGTPCQQVPDQATLQGEKAVARFVQGPGLDGTD